MPRVAETFEGTPCKHGHTLRYVKGRGCVQCARDKAAERQVTHAEDHRRYKADWKKRNPESVRKSNITKYWKRPEHWRQLAREARDRDPEAANARTQEWRAANPEHLRQYALDKYWSDPETSRRLGREAAKRSLATRRKNQNLRRGRIAGAAGHHTLSQIEAILVAQGGRCAYCAETENLHLDHAIPISRGGSNWPWNLQWLCASHNMRKSAKTDSEYRAEIGLPKIIWVSLRMWASALFLNPEKLIPEVAD